MSKPPPLLVILAPIRIVQSSVLSYDLMKKLWRSVRGAVSAPFTGRSFGNTDPGEPIGTEWNRLLLIVSYCCVIMIMPEDLPLATIRITFLERRQTFSTRNCGFHSFWKLLRLRRRPRSQAPVALGAEDAWGCNVLCEDPKIVWFISVAVQRSSVRYHEIGQISSPSTETAENIESLCHKRASPGCSALFSLIWTEVNTILVGFHLSFLFGTTCLASWGPWNADAWSWPCARPRLRRSSRTAFNKVDRNVSLVVPTSCFLVLCCLL